jgi:hypothetical protein
MKSSSWAGAAPPFLLGMGLAVTVLVSAGLLLYGGPGFLPALTVVVGAQLGALAAGLILEAGIPGDPHPHRLRSRWFFVLAASALAAVFSGLWEVQGGFGASVLSQLFGLAFLAILPLFAGGALLGTLTRVHRGGGPSAASPGAAALLGGGAGAVLLGVFFFPVFRSSTALLLLVLVGLSVGALIQGWGLEGRLWVAPGSDDEARSSTSGGGTHEARVERWTTVEGEGGWTVLARPGEILTVTGQGGAPALELDRALCDWLAHSRGEGGRGLVLGVGRIPQAISVSNGGPDGPGGWRMELLDAWHRGAARFVEATGLDSQGRSGSSVVVRDVEVGEALEGSPRHLPPGSFDLIILDTMALGVGRSGIFRFRPGVLLRLHSALRPGGVLVVGPLQDGGTAGPLLEGTPALMAKHFSRTSAYVSGAGSTGAVDVWEVPPGRGEGWARLHPEPGARAAFVVAARDGGLENGVRHVWPDRVRGFLRVILTEPKERSGPDADAVATG